MRKYINPGKEQWAELSARPEFALDFLEGSVKNILTRVQKSGDSALRELTLQFDKVKLDQIQVTETEIEEAQNLISAALQDAIRTAAANIQKFHSAQKRPVEKIETTKGVVCWRKGVPISSVGIYIPGGTAPLLSTVLMLAIPASIAGSKEIILCTPPDTQGKVNAGILFAAKVSGVKKIFKVGGAQAIAAMAYGTETIPKVDKIFGPGNQYVTKAKQIVSNEGVAIDLPAGPSEVLVYADETAEPAFVAADLLSQAEHGEDSQVVLVLTDDSRLNEIQEELARQLELLPRKIIAQTALSNSSILIFSSSETAVEFIDSYAPEHLIICTRNAPEVAEKVMNAGSVFIGNYAAEAIGDYASGTNHTLPTNGYARTHAGVSLDSFLKYITYQQVSVEGLINIGPVVEQLASAEQLDAHKNAIRIRLQTIKQN